jgi:glycosidase
MKRAALALGLVAGLPAAAAAQTPWWNQNTVCYEVFVRSFYDSDGDGIGDLNGLIQKLDYINDGDPRSKKDLGANCIWLMPVAESPSYHGYDVVDYYRVERDYGTKDDFKRLVAEAHRRGIRVLVDLVLNHTSSDHPFFKQATVDPNSPYRSWFRFSPTAPDEKGSWDQVIWHRNWNRDEYYFGLFVREMPDLDYRNPAVMAEAQRVAAFWLDEMGVDGFRLDAVAHLTEDGNVTKNAPSVHPVLREFGQFVRRTKPQAFTVGEVMDSTMPMVPYYPDQLDSHFAFETGDAILDALRLGTARAFFPRMMRLQREIPAQRYAPILRNHDQTRAMTEMGGDWGKARVAATLLLTLPGTPFLYYGEEIGITGDKPDPRLRTPMQWTRAPNAGFTRGLPWEPLQPDTLVANVQVQDADPASLLNLYRELVHLRTSHPALSGAGELVPLSNPHDAVAAYLRRSGDRVTLVLVNLGAAPVRGAALTSEGRVLPAGRRAPAALIGGARPAPLRVGADGRIRGYVPLGTLAPHAAHVFDLTPGP